MKRVLTVFLLAACVSVNKSVLDASFQNTPVPQEKVAVLLASVGDSLPEACTRVAILHASGAEDWTDEADIVNKLRDETGKLGGNTVFIQDIVDPGAGERFASALFGTTSDRDSDAIALFC